MNFRSEVLLREVGGEMAFYGLTDNGLRTVKTGLPPYAFVLKEDYDDGLEAEDLGCSFEETDLKARVNGVDKPVVMFTAPYPDSIGRISKLLENRGIMVFEGDIRYIRRVFTDKVFGIDYKDAYAYIDIEVDDREGYKDYGVSKIIACSVGFSGVIETFMDGDEKQLLENVVDFLKKSEKTVLVGWNVDYDANQIKARMQKLGLNTRWYDICNFFDLRDAYKYAVKGLSSYSLYEVSKFEGTSPKLIGKRVSDMTVQELRDYNRRDVEILMEIDKKYGFVQKKLDMMSKVGLPLSMSNATFLGDTLILRRLRELGYVARNGKRIKVRESYRGAYIREPKSGIYENIAVIDGKSLYPSVVMYKKIDVEGFNGEVLPYILVNFSKLKDEADKRKDKVSREIYKTLMNSLYGLFGTVGFRFYDRNKAQSVTDGAREVIMRIMNLLEELGFEVIYGDTDSAFFKADSVERLDGVIEYIQKCIKPFEIKLEHKFKKMLIFAKESGGAKKRYVGMEEDGTIFVRGIETRRGDWCMLSKNVLDKAIKIVFESPSPTDAVKSIEKMMREVKADLFAGKYDADLVITKSVKTEGYKVKTPQYEAWKKAVEMGKIPKDSVEISYYFKVGNKIEPYFEGDELKDVDYKKYWENQIQPPIERLIKSITAVSKGVQMTL